MKYGLCHLSVVPLRSEKSDESEMVNQVIYGESFKIIESRKKWSKIRLSHDSYEGWIDNKQFIDISSDIYKDLTEKEPLLLSDIVHYVSTKENGLMPLKMVGKVQLILNIVHDLLR